jgi:hypothetical protein
LVEVRVKGEGGWGKKGLRVAREGVLAGVEGRPGCDREYWAMG